MVTVTVSFKKWYVGRATQGFSNWRTKIEVAKNEGN